MASPVMFIAARAFSNESWRSRSSAISGSESTALRGRTTIAIAHRLSTLRRADRLVVLEHGVVTEIGRHDELLERDGTYARLHKAQLDMAHGNVTEVTP